MVASKLSLLLYALLLMVVVLVLVAVLSIDGSTDVRNLVHFSGRITHLTSAY